MVTDSYEIYKAVLAQLPDGIIVVDSDDKIIFVNKAAEEVRHIQAEQKVGNSVILCHPEKSHDKIKRALQFLRSEETKTFRRMVVDTTKEKYFENSYVPIRDNSNGYIGSVVISKDITDRRKLEEERAARLQNLEERAVELEEKFQGLLVSSMTVLVNALEAKDPYTKGLSMRVSDMAARVAEHVYSVSPEVEEIKLAGKLHDIGKIGVRESVLNKADKLTEDEFNHIKEHPVIGERILMPVAKLKSVAKIARHHHERYDGKGYPDGLRGEEVPVGSRILAIADSFDAMTSARPYRSALAGEIATEEIKKNLGTQFDPEWGETFLELYYSGSIG